MKRVNRSLYQSFKLYGPKFRNWCLWSGVAALQASVTIMVRLGISGHKAESYMVYLTNHLELVLHSKGNSSKNRKKKKKQA